MSGVGWVTGRKVGMSILQRSQKKPAVFWNVAYGPSEEFCSWWGSEGMKGRSALLKGVGKGAIVGAVGSPKGLNRGMTLPGTFIISVWRTE